MIHYERGEYVVRITEQGWTKTKAKELPMLVFQCLPVRYVVKDEEGNEQFEEVYADANFPERTLRVVIDSENDKGMDYAMKKLRYAGFTGDSFTDLNLVGIECRATCEHGQYDGKDTENWELCLPPLERTSKPIDNAVARRLDALFGKRLKDGAVTPAAKPEPSRSPEPQSQPQQTVPDDAGEPPFDDDVPF